MTREALKENFIKSMKNLIRRISFAIDDFDFYMSDPFSINCFEQTSREIARMTDEERERVLRKIDELE